MSESLSEWLALREAADWSARSSHLVQRVCEALAQSGEVRALDLCTGTGSNLRYLLDRLPELQRWLVVDHDSTLLDEVPARLSAWAHSNACGVTTDGGISHVRGNRIDARIETLRMDLAELHTALFEGRNLVTASALLDLVSERWLRDLAARCRDAGAVVLLALTYDGRWECVPAEPDDVSVRELFNQHQRSAPGLGGPALGPAAADAAERALAQEGFAVERAASDWTLSAGSRWGAELQRRLIEGWAEAAAEIAPDRRDEIDDWLARRLAHVDAGRSRIVVGHQDVAGIPKLTT
jgi:hypothetical protein